MLRVAVAAYLMVVTLAGPWLCCCTTTRLTALLSRTAAADESDCPCCCHSPGTLQDGADKSKSPDRPDCPCKRASAGEPVLVQPKAEAFTLLHAVQFWDQLTPALPGLLAPCDPAVYARERVLPFLTAEDFLHVHHLLRC